MATDARDHGPRGGVDWRVMVVLIGGTTCTCLQAAASRGQIRLPGLATVPFVSPAILIAYLVVPSVLAVAIGENPLRYVVPQVWRGSRRSIGLFLGALIVGATAVALLEADSPFAGRPVAPASLVGTVATLFCVEFFFRGFLLFPLLPRFGWHALAVAAFPYALAHVGKPAWELFGSVPFGLATGYLAVRTRSIFYGFVLHVALALAGTLAASS